MLMHSPEPVRLSTLAQDHPLHGYDIRRLSDVRLAEAAARGILPDLERLFVSTAAGLAGTVLRRVARIVGQRAKADGLTGAGDVGLDVQDELLEIVTLCFVHMAGAFDALAIAFGLAAGESDYPSMGWQRASFRSRVRHIAPETVALFDSGRTGALYLRAVLDFRNTVHRLMPDTGVSGRADGDPALCNAILAIERRSHPEILQSFEDVGWTRFVGIGWAGRDLLILRPDTLLTCLLNDGVALLNLLIADIADSTSSDRLVMDPDQGLYPQQMRSYAVRYFGLGHLAATP